MSKNAYYNISFNNAKKFIKSLPKNKISDLCDLYDIKVSESTDFESIYDDNESVDALASTISDNDLYSLGYKDNDCDEEDHVSEYNYSVHDVEEFLSTLDEFTLYDLYKKYDTIHNSELAVVITDDELYNLGFEGLKNCYDDDDECYDKPCKLELPPSYKFMSDDEITRDDYDFFEDVDYNTPILIINPDDLLFGVEGEYVFNALKSQLDPNLVACCDICDDINIAEDLVVFKITPVIYSEPVDEDVVINSELNPALFDNNTQILKEDVHTQLMDYVNGFVQKMQNKSIPVDYSDIQMIGSNAGYLYTPESDIDIHFIWNYPMNVDNFEQMKAEFVDYVTENPLDIGGHMVELNLEDGANMEASSKRRYSVLNNNWVEGSQYEEVYTPQDIVKVDGYEEQVDEYSKKIDDVIKNNEYAEAVALKQEIRANRSEDLANIGSLSMGNVVFKELRNNGKFGELREYIKSKELESKDGAEATVTE